MKLFVDSANVEEIEGLVPLGIVDGVTTNPSLLGKAGRDPQEVLESICRLVSGPVSAEVVATEADGMIGEGRKLSTISEHIVVKVPFGREGVKACGALSREGIRVNVTLVFSATQALLAAKAGATFVSPFVGRHDDNGFDGMALIRDIRLIYDNYPNFSTEILVASIRNPVHVLESARIGADVATMPAAVIKGLFKHVLTEKGIEGFLKDWDKTGQSIPTA